MQARSKRVFSQREIEASRCANYNRFCETGAGVRVLRDGEDITEQVERLGAAAADPRVTPTHAAPEQFQ